MKPFNLSDYLDNKSREIVTRNGHAVRIVCTNANVIHDGYTYNILALIKKKDNTNHPASFTENGLYIVGEKHNLDLFFKPIMQKEGWTNVYRNTNNQIVTDTVFETKEEALSRKSEYNYLDTIQIKWEE